MSQLTTHGFTVNCPGVLSLLQDQGRFAQSHLGLTQGGPADKHAFDVCQTLLSNNLDATIIEVSIGGLVLTSHCQTIGCITGANIKVTLNGNIVDLWGTFVINNGDVLEFFYSEQGVRCYFGVTGGFDIKPQFSSTSTVLRESIGGANGKALNKGDHLPVHKQLSNASIHKAYPKTLVPQYPNDIVLRIILGYQSSWFSDLQITRFLNSEYKISKQWDRMGYRLQGPTIQCDTRSMLSEGITQGAVQIPADGQPIILLNDRQTIGGYPKIGSVLSLDLDKLTQCKQGATIRFEAINIEDAHNLLHLARYKFEHTQFENKANTGNQVNSNQY